MEVKYVPIDPRDAVEAAYDMGFKAGLKEVVDWLEDNCMLSVLDKSRFTYKDVGSITFSLGNLKDSKEWKAKLKNWGIKPSL